MLERRALPLLAEHLPDHAGTPSSSSTTSRAASLAWLADSPLMRTESATWFDSERGKVCAVERTLYRDVVLSERAVAPDPGEAAALLAREAARDPEAALRPDRDTARLLGRSLEEFVGANFLQESVIRDRIGLAKLSERVGHWLVEPENSMPHSNTMSPTNDTATRTMMILVESRSCFIIGMREPPDSETGDARGIRTIVRVREAGAMEDSEAGRYPRSGRASKSSRANWRTGSSR